MPNGIKFLCAIEKQVMDKKDNELQEQQAPLKNTDKAFVKVGHEGEPVIPENTGNKQEEPKQDRSPESDKR